MPAVTYDSFARYFSGLSLKLTKQAAQHAFTS